jgi:hypothetical protein
MRHVALEVPLRAFAVVGAGRGHHAAHARIQALGDALDDAALAGRVAPSNRITTLWPWRHPVLQLHQFALQPEELAKVALNAVVRRMDDEALAAADAADAARARGEALGPLHGVPVTTKINVDQKGHPTDNGVVAYKDLMATEDSPVVANLKARGCHRHRPHQCAGLLDAHLQRQRPARPHAQPAGPGDHARRLQRRRRCRGGGGHRPIAHGNDIGGSVRIPATCCGVVGLRTAFGRVPAFNPSAPGGRPSAGS